MKKIIFALLMIISTQGHCFPHLADYNVKKNIRLQKNGRQKIIVFDDNVKGLFTEMYLFSVGDFHGRFGTCDITGYSIWIQGTGKDTKMSICKKGGKIEEQTHIQFLEKGFLSYFDGGYVTAIMESDEIYISSWVEYTK